MLGYAMNQTFSVFVVHHLHIHENGIECVKMIGVYESRPSAVAAVKRLGEQPGFRDWPKIINPVSDDQESGFYIDEYRINEDHWTEGFVTMP